MKGFLSVALALTSIAQVAADNWAVIVAGSNDYSNYRHQADACNAVKLFKARGVPESNIISLIWDDIAFNKNNPYPGKIFNKPTAAGVEGEDVYADCHISYKAPDVNAALFRAVLEGNKDYVPKSGQKGKVLESTKDDRVFVFYSDHGAVGLVAVVNDYLYSDELLSSLEVAHSKGLYKELVFYLESCESGSMFVNLKDNLNIYATTASLPNEDSWGTYCSPQDLVNGKHVGSCLGDLYSVNWLEDVWAADLNKETLEEDFKTVERLTTRSHVQQYGDLSEDTEPLKNFFASSKYSPASFRRSHLKESRNSISTEVKTLSAVNSRNIRLNYLTNMYQNAKTVEEKEIASMNLQAEIDHRDAMDEVFSNGVSLLVNKQAFAKLNDGIEVIPKSFDCLRGANNIIEESCGRYSDYSLKFVKHVVYMCEEKVSQGMSQAAAAELIGNVVGAECMSVLATKPIRTAA